MRWRLYFLFKSTQNFILPMIAVSYAIYAMFFSGNQLLAQQFEGNQHNPQWQSVLPDSLPLRSFIEAKTPPLVGTNWVRSKIGQDNFRILDIRLQNTGKFKAGHIPGAISAPYPGEWVKWRKNIPAMLPETKDLEKLIGSLGINNETLVVINSSGKTNRNWCDATRVFWTLRYMGHTKVTILNGGFNAWNKDQPGALEEGEDDPQTLKYKAQTQPKLLITTDEVFEIRTGPTLLVDARSTKEFRGFSKHALAKRYGRLPDATHLNYERFIDQKTKKIKDLNTINQTVVQSLNLNVSEIVSYSNIGHCAALNWFILSELLKLKNVRLYDESMVGWSRDANLPMQSDRTIWTELKHWAQWPLQLVGLIKN